MNWKLFSLPKTEMLVPTIEEGRLVFDFPADWLAIRYDQEPDDTTPPGFYRRVVVDGNEEFKLPNLQWIRGIDFVCRTADVKPKLQFIEVKDDVKRQIPAETRHRELYQTVVRKTFNTLAGLQLAERLHEPSLHQIACLSQWPRIEVILFLEEPAPVIPAGANSNLRRGNKKNRRLDLELQLLAKLGQWDVPFYLYNLTTRKPPHWHVRVQSPTTTP